MNAGVTVVAGIPIPSTSPLFLGVAAVHALTALAAVIAGAAAMLSRKAAGRHPRFGTIYYCSLAVSVGLTLVLAGLRWREDAALAALGVASLAAATLGRTARRRTWRRWIPLHIGGMGGSYILMLTAFYVDNGKNLPVWRALPELAYWLVPTLIGAPITLRAIARRLRAEQVA
jgi:hypothetical protein